MLTAALTESTCGPACWEAREETCRCSCGGRNHGVAKLQGTPGAVRPERTCKIAGRWYRLEAVGRYSDIRGRAYDYNVPGRTPDGQRDYRTQLPEREQAVDRTAAAHQLKWPEVANFLQVDPRYRPHLLWVPTVRPGVGKP